MADTDNQLALCKLAWGCRARTGGALTKCVFAFVHTAVHLLVALMLMVLLELGVETCIRSAYSLPPLHWTHYCRQPACSKLSDPGT